MTKIFRIFPRRTKATPDDSMTSVGHIQLIRPECDEVHVSVTFSWDKSEAEIIADEYRQCGYRVKIGGVAYGDPGGEFVPGLYVKPGYVFTSRGCPGRCWFCDVWRREGAVRELPITEGWNILDSNLLACSEKHILNVLDMLRKQPHAPEFTGGLDPRYMTVDVLREIKTVKPKQIFTAYDTEDDWQFIPDAIANCWKAGFRKESHTVRAFALIGYPRDTFEQAEIRLNRLMNLGVIPMAMLYRDDSGKVDRKWQQFQRVWARPAITASSSASDGARGKLQKGANDR